MNSGLQGNIRQVREADEDYPEALFETHDRPPVLYVKGRWPLPKDALLIGIVGARKASRYGLDASSSIATELIGRGVVTVSGMAAGIDAAAHRASLDAQGWTIGILGHGFGHLYPRENKTLFEQMAQEGTLITEFPFEAEPLAAHFPQRNRIISGLSSGVVVIEAGEHSGALITARFAAEQGRDVFAVPGSPFQWQCRGSNRLIKEGATLVESGEDVLNEFGLFHPRLSARTTPQAELPRDEQTLLEELQAAPLSMDDLVELSGKPIERLAELLLSLELKGRISMMPGQLYVARN